jgi:hypothetical protein
LAGLSGLSRLARDASWAGCAPGAALTALARCAPGATCSTGAAIATTAALAAGTSVAARPAFTAGSALAAGSAAAVVAGRAVSARIVGREAGAAGVDGDAADGVAARGRRGAHESQRGNEHRAGSNTPARVVNDLV